MAHGRRWGMCFCFWREVLMLLRGESIDEVDKGQAGL